jgi:hypothetical protein
MGTVGNVPTSITNMTPGNPFIKGLASIPIADGVVAHSIIAVEGDGSLDEAGDGVVKYKSAHIDGVASEKIVRSSHSVQGNLETIQEVKRILIEHAKDCPFRGAVVKLKQLRKNVSRGAEMLIKSCAANQRDSGMPEQHWSFVLHSGKRGTRLLKQQSERLCRTKTNKTRG